MQFKELLDRAVEAHGHLCPGQVLGVRMGILGLGLLGFEAPLSPQDIKKVVVVVEIDRCAADALGTTTGVKLGRRSLRFKDYGLMAASFYRLTDQKAFRVAVREECRPAAASMFPEIEDSVQREIQAYQVMDNSELFRVDEVKINLQPEDLPGFQGDKVICEACGATIRHRRFVEVQGRKLCRVCAGTTYFETLSPVTHLDLPNRKTESRAETGGARV